MISDSPLPDGHTARRLAAALAEAGAPPGMVRRAERGYYHDYLSPLALPEMALINELRSAAARADLKTREALVAVARDVRDGKHDASRAEADEWMRSPEGRETSRALGPYLSIPEPEADAMTCACGQSIERCNCGGQACTGWGHLPPASRHWCGRTPADGQPRPASPAARPGTMPRPTPKE